MSYDAAISVIGLGKSYRMYQRPRDRLLHMFFGSRSARFQEFWAVRNISFTIDRGETVGIIGRNGSGKSTLLQLICGTLTPSEGFVRTNGRVAALLELGAGFNPEFSGRENALLNASILGISQSAMDMRMQEVLDFSELGDFLDQPVKNYSSGMYARLAFSIAIHVDPDILVIDEALSVGDVFFQVKCLRRIEELRQRGTTILFVSHDLHTVQRICQRVLLLDHGEIVSFGSARETCDAYYSLHQAVDASVSAPADQEASCVSPVVVRRDSVTGDGSVVIGEVEISPAANSGGVSVSVNGEIMVRVELRFNRDMSGCSVGAGIRDRTGILVGGAHTGYASTKLGTYKSGESVWVGLRFRAAVAPGEYLLVVGVATDLSEGWVDHCTYWDCLRVEVLGRPAFWGLTDLGGTVVVGMNRSEIR